MSVNSECQFGLILYAKLLVEGDCQLFQIPHAELEVSVKIDCQLGLIPSAELKVSVNSDCQLGLIPSAEL